MTAIVVQAATAARASLTAALTRSCAYVYQGAVGHYGWLTPVQMLDGLALGETTPGPLIMVVAFVGFVGGYVKMIFGPDDLIPAGVAAATLVTWLTFLPSFMFILAGGPLTETTHNDFKFTAPLTAITAAVALFRFRRNVIHVIAACAALGLLVRTYTP